jgi:glycosyltransferase involved in cell wall biosynthesis
MTEQEERPLVTFALFAYNQERFIREAVEGALAQTYSPLQVILSDDCSTDRTFEIMQEMVADYTGPHEILLNRNERNLGIGGHVNRVMDLSRGELIVVAAGDDISLPSRTDILASAWRNSTRRFVSLYSDYLEIDDDGSETGLVRKGPVEHDIPTMIRNAATSGRGVFGATHAWTRHSFDLFGPIDSRVIYEDKVIPFRNAVVGEIVHVDQVLVKYRRLSQSLSHHAAMSTYAHWARQSATNYRNRRVAFESNLRDLNTAAQMGCVSAAGRSQISALLEMEIERCAFRVQFREGGLRERVAAIWKSGHCLSLSERLKYLALSVAPGIYDLAFAQTRR